MKNVINYARRLSVLGVACLSIYVPGRSFAFNSSDSIQLSVTGALIATSCQVDIVENVDLGEISRQALSVPGGNSGLVVVSFKLSQCSPQVTQATVSFTGPSYSADPAFASAIYSNELSDGAKDIGLQLLNIDGKAYVNLANGVSYTFPVKQETHSGVLPVGARMYSPHGEPTSGYFKSSVTVNFIYQ